LRERMKAVRAFKSAFIPKKRPGRKPKEAVTAAYEEWKAGMRGLVPYRKHIPNWEKRSRWRRQVEQRALLDAIYSRERRAKKRATESSAA
jgi:hypothetical protein